MMREEDCWWGVEEEATAWFLSLATEGLLGLP